MPYPQCSPSVAEGHAANCVTPIFEVIDNLTPGFLQRAGEALANTIRPLIENLSSNRNVELSGKEPEQEFVVSCCGMPTRETARK